VKCLVSAVSFVRNGGACLVCGTLAGLAEVTCRPWTGRSSGPGAGLRGPGRGAL